MNKVYWSFGDFVKRSSFCTIRTLDISNTDMAKAKNELTRTSYSFIISQKKQTKKKQKICQNNLDPQILSPKGDL